MSPTPGKVKILAVSDMITRGPDGQKAVPGSSIHLTSSTSTNRLRGHHYTAAMIWDAQTTWFNAVSMGARAVFKELGIRVVAQTQYNFDLSVEKTQVDTVMALHPNILLTIADDPVISGRALQTAVTAGTKIVLLSTMQAGWKSGKQYVTMVTGDQAAMGIGDAKALVKDQAVAVTSGFSITMRTISSPTVTTKLLLPKSPAIIPRFILWPKRITTPNQAEALTGAMLVQHPQIKGIYAAWDAVTESTRCRPYRLVPTSRW